MNPVLRSPVRRLGSLGNTLDFEGQFDDRNEVGGDGYDDNNEVNSEGWGSWSLSRKVICCHSYCLFNCLNKSHRDSLVR